MLQYAGIERRVAGWDFKISPAYRSKWSKGICLDLNGSHKLQFSQPLKEISSAPPKTQSVHESGLGQASRVCLSDQSCEIASNSLVDAKASNSTKDMSAGGVLDDDEAAQIEIVSRDEPPCPQVTEPRKQLRKQNKWKKTQKKSEIANAQSETLRPTSASIVASRSEALSGLTRQREDEQCLQTTMRGSENQTELVSKLNGLLATPAAQGKPTLNSPYNSCGNTLDAHAEKAPGSAPSRGLRKFSEAQIIGRRKAWNQIAMPLPSRSPIRQENIPKATSEMPKLRAASEDVIAPIGLSCRPPELTPDRGSGDGAGATPRSSSASSPRKRGCMKPVNNINDPSETVALRKSINVGEEKGGRHEQIKQEGVIAQSPHDILEPRLTATEITSCRLDSKSHVQPETVVHVANIVETCLEGGIKPVQGMPRRVFKKKPKKSRAKILDGSGDKDPKEAT